MSPSLTVKCFCLTPEGGVLRLTLKQIEELTRGPTSIRCRAFANHSIRFSEYILTVNNRKPESIERVIYYLIRFDNNGRPDIARYQENINAIINNMWDKALNLNKDSGNIINMENQFKSNGGKWKPTLAESQLLDQAAFSQIKVSRLTFDTPTGDFSA